MTIAIGEGDSAASMSRKVREYLNDPDLMFRRFRYKDDEGNWQLKWKKRITDPDTGKHTWIDYDKDSYRDEWTGPGYYKSSAKNAMRVTRTETNMAYRAADSARWEQLDFILGIHIQPSESHPQPDICDMLAGDYPKTFKFSGWHPQCFCIMTPILPKDEELVAMADARAEGEEYTPETPPVTEYPKGFKDFVYDNADDIKKARRRGTEPYFLQDNRAQVDNILSTKGKSTQGFTEMPKLISGKGDPIFDYINDYNLPKSIRDRFYEFESLRSFNDFKGFFAQRGIELTTDDLELLARADEYFEPIALQCRKLAIAHDTYTDLLGKDCLSALKRINLFDTGEDMGRAQAAYFYNMIGEKDPWAGVLRIQTNNLNGHTAFHELAHAIQDSVKRKGEDAVMAASRLIRECKLDDSVKAYFGASSSAMDAERMADAFANVFTRKNKQLETTFFADVRKYLYEQNADAYIGQSIVEKGKDYIIGKRFAGLKTHEEVATTLSGLLDKRLGYDVEVEIDANLIDLSTTKAYATRIESLTRRYNLKQAKLGKIKLGYLPSNDTEMGETYFDTKRPKILSLTDKNDMRYNDRTGVASRCEKEDLHLSTLTHEFGHLLYQIRQTCPSEYVFLESTILKEYNNYINDFNNAIISNDMNALHKISLGRRSTANINEFIAEAFQEYINCKNPTPYAIRIGKMLDSYFKR